MEVVPPAGGGAFLPGLKTRGILRRELVKGSHFVYKHADYGACLCLTQHGRAFQPWQWRNLLGDLRRMGAHDHAAALEARHGAAA